MSNRNAKNKAADDYAGREFVITHEFSAPRATVFKAWTDPEQLARWWGPRGFTNPVCEWDARPGGAIHVVMRAPNGAEYPMGGRFRALAAPERLVFTAGPLDAKGNLLFELLHAVTFVERGSRTALTIHSRVTKTTAGAGKYLAGYEAGMNQSLERLADLAADSASREIVVSRVFDAPRELVWQAMTDPQHVVRWWGPNGFTTTIANMDVRPGGVWQHVMHGPDGTDYPNKSVFQEVVKPERIVYSHGGGRKGGRSVHFVTTWTFEALDGNKTRLTMHSVFPSSAARDFAVKEYGAIEGGKQTLARLAEHLPMMTPAAKEFVLTRTFAAPRALVWRAWTEAELLQRWFGPKGFTMPACSLDLRPGGVFHYGMKSPDGHEVWGKWTFREIVPPEKLVVIISFSDAQGGVTRHPLSAHWPLETLSTMTLTELDGKTTVTLRWAPHAATEIERQAFDSSHEGMRQGWAGTMEQLEAYLAQSAANAGPEFVISRVLDAPRELVWQAWADPVHMARWWGPRAFTNPVCEMDVRPGGAYRIVMRSPEGVDYPIKGVFREVTEPGRLVLTMDASEHPDAWHDMINPSRRKGENAAGMLLQTVTFEDLDGQTRLTIGTRFESIAIRDAMVRMGMNEGWSQSLERLVEALGAVSIGAR
ncbi:MAG TPA: SRPBCC domain-containing protein [Opitutaceae bacterium]|nr:SRPBCC domain-containing protein [Opitutaceae bacterium]